MVKTLVFSPRCYILQATFSNSARKGIIFGRLVWERSANSKLSCISGNCVSVVNYSFCLSLCPRPTENLQNFNSVSKMRQYVTVDQFTRNTEGLCQKHILFGRNIVTSSDWRDQQHNYRVVNRQVENWYSYRNLVFLLAVFRHRHRIIFVQICNKNKVGLQVRSSCVMITVPYNTGLNYELPIASVPTNVRSRCSHSVRHAERPWP